MKFLMPLCSKQYLDKNKGKTSHKKNMSNSGSLMYLINYTGPNIAYAVSCLSYHTYYFKWIIAIFSESLLKIDWGWASFPYDFAWEKLDRGTSQQSPCCFSNFIKFRSKFVVYNIIIHVEFRRELFIGISIYVFYFNWTHNIWYDAFIHIHFIELKRLNNELEIFYVLIWILYRLKGMQKVSID